MTPAALTEMIRTESYPESVNSFYRDWLKSLFQRGKVQQATRMLQSILENPLQPREKTLLAAFPNAELKRDFV